MEINRTMQSSADIACSSAAWLMQSEPLPWYVVYVKSRHEFIAYADLVRRGIVAFLPSVIKCSQWKDRKKRIAFPLFPGYVFVQLPPQAGTQLTVLQARGVVAFIALGQGKPAPVAPEEITALRLMVESGKEIDLYPDMKTGTRVRIKSGPLKNAEGIVSKREHAYAFHVNIELLGRSVAVAINAQDLEAS